MVATGQPIQNNQNQSLPTATRVEISTVSPRDITDSRRPLNESSQSDPLARLAYSDTAANQYISPESYNSPGYSQFIQQYQSNRELNLFPSETPIQQNNQVIPTVPPNTGAQNSIPFSRLQNPDFSIANRSQFNELNSIRFPTQGKYKYTPPDSQNIDWKYDWERHRPPPESIPSLAALQSQSNTLLSQGGAILGQNRDIDVRNANTVAALNLIGNQPSSGTNNVTSRNTRAGIQGRLDAMRRGQAQRRT